jgi:outer membrane protein assembly factor BamB
LAYKINNGYKLWSVKAGPIDSGYSEIGAPIVVNDKVIVSHATHIICPVLLCGGAGVKALSVRDGALRWVKSVPAWITGIAAVNDKVVVSGGYPGTIFSPSSRYGYMSSVSASDGNTVWEHFAERLNYYQEPSVSEGMVLSSNGVSLSALDMSSGNLLWSTSLSSADSNRQLYQKPILANGVVYINESRPNSGFGSLWMFDAVNGQILKEVTGVNSDLPPLVVNGKAYTTSVYGWTDSWGLSSSGDVK